MRRKLVNLATIVSLLLCVATVALWVRSYWRSDLIKRSRWDYNGGSINKKLDERTIHVGRGVVCLGHEFNQGYTSYHSGLFKEHGAHDIWIEWVTKPAAESVRMGGTGFWNRRGFA